MCEARTVVPLLFLEPSLGIQEKRGHKSPIHSPYPNLGSGVSDMAQPALGTPKTSLSSSLRTSGPCCSCCSQWLNAQRPADTELRQAWGLHSALGIRASDTRASSSRGLLAWFISEVMQVCLGGCCLMGLGQESTWPTCFTFCLPQPKTMVVAGDRVSETSSQAKRNNQEDSVF